MTSAEREQFIADLMLQSGVTREQVQAKLSLIAHMLAGAFPQIAARARQIGSGGETLGPAVSPRPEPPDEYETWGDWHS